MIWPLLFWMLGPNPQLKQPCFTRITGDCLHCGCDSAIVLWLPQKQYRRTCLQGLSLWRLSAVSLHWEFLAAYGFECHVLWLLQKLAEMAEVLQVREGKVVTLSRENNDLLETNAILRRSVSRLHEGEGCLVCIFSIAIVPFISSKACSWCDVLFLSWNVDLTHSPVYDLAMTCLKCACYLIGVFVRILSLQGSFHVNHITR